MSDAQNTQPPSDPTRAEAVKELVEVVREREDLRNMTADNIAYDQRIAALTALLSVPVAGGILHQCKGCGFAFTAPRKNGDYICPDCGGRFMVNEGTAPVAGEGGGHG